MDKISNVKELKNIKKDGSYVLTKNIDCHGENICDLLPIFSGVIDGKNFKIFNAKLTKNIESDSMSISLFKEIRNATIKNIKFDDISIISNNSTYFVKSAFICDIGDNSLLENISLNVRSDCESNFLIYDGCDVELKSIDFSVNKKKIIKYFKNND